MIGIFFNLALGVSQPTTAAHIRSKSCCMVTILQNVFFLLQKKVNNIYDSLTPQIRILLSTSPHLQIFKG